MLRSFDQIFRVTSYENPTLTYYYPGEGRAVFSSAEFRYFGRGRLNIIKHDRVFVSNMKLLKILLFWKFNDCESLKYCCLSYKMFSEWSCILYFFHIPRNIEIKSVEAVWHLRLSSNSKSGNFVACHSAFPSSTNSTIHHAAIFTYQFLYFVSSAIY